MAMPTWLQEFGVIGTWAVAIVALFGDRLRAMLFKPDLHLELKSEVGSWCPQSVGAPDGGARRFRDAHYYHLRVTNRARYPSAKDVQGLLLGVERLEQEPQRPGELYVPLSLGWAGGVYPLAREIGTKTDAIADLLFVHEDGSLEFVVVHAPFNFQSVYSGETHLRATAVAKGVDCESNILRLEIHWDGMWERDEEAMKKHFKIRALATEVEGRQKGRWDRDRGIRFVFRW
jgi:hypothetical protein